MKIKKLLSLFMVICMIFSMLAVGFTAHAAQVEVEEISADANTAEMGAEAETAGTGANLYGLAENVQDGQILQCWTWSYNNISKNLQKIAEQGFSAIQTSPIQPIKESTKEYYNTMMNSSWVIYQPVAFSIEDNYRNVQGTKKEFEAMCEEAHKYGIKVIVDIVFNHMANDMSGNTIHPWIPSEIRNNSDCWHDISKNISNYNDRYETTQYCLTGLPDLNTSNSIVQKHCTNLLKEAIDAGADGFRFDAVKHIETPWDANGIKSDFWPNVLGAATEYAQETRGFTPYYYGELLGSPGGSLSIEAYTQYMSVTDPGSSDSIRNGVCNGNASAAASSNISNGASKSKVVQWTESHDNHKDNGTADISERNINKTWAMVGSKDKVCGMYLARPEDMDTTMMGDADMTSWSYPEVRAVNRFKNAFIGQSEYLSSYNKLACIERGTSGMIIVNTGGSYYNGIKVPVHKMASGTYTDAITGNTFTVSGGYIKGDIGDTGIAVVYNEDSVGAFTKGAVTDVALAGTLNDWSTTSHKLIAKDANTASVSMFLSKGTYTFKITANDIWYGNSGTIEDTTGSNGWTMRSSVSDKCTLEASGGKYTFTINISNGKLVVDYEDTTDKTSSVYLMGTFNEWDDSKPMIYADETNTVSTAITLSAGTYTFKLYNSDIGAWYGNKGTIKDTTGDTGWTMSPTESANCTITATGGTYTFAFDLSTQKLSVERAEDDVVSTFTVTFVDYDGKVLKTQTVDYGTSATAPEVPEREGYTFKGWDTDFDSVKSDITVTAQYTNNATYLKGTFNNWNDSNLMTATSDSNVVTTILELEPGTYEFKVQCEDVWYGNNGTIADTTASTSDIGWGMKNGANKCKLTATGGTYTFNFNTSTHYLEVLHSAPMYTVTFQNYDGTVLSEQTVERGKSATAPVTPTREGNAQYTYTFKEWDKAFDNITEDTVVTARYTEALNKYTVTFKDYDGTELSVQTVEYGASATAPEAPKREGYTFSTWDKSYTNITADTVITAKYSKIETGPAIGTLRVDVAGGTGFSISVDGGNARPQGPSYTNTKMPVGSTVTVTAKAASDATFLGWINPANGQVLSKDFAYTFVTGGNDYIKASYVINIEGAKLVAFKNDKAFGGLGHLIDMQYYSSEDSIVFPDNPTQVGFDFAGWNMTEAEIQAAIARGEDVTVLAKWTKQSVYVNVTVNGGTGGGRVEANFQTIVTANPAPEGKKFAYWTDGDGNIKSYFEEYKFFPSADTTLTAVFVDENEEVKQQILVSLDTIDTVTVEGKNVFYYSWYLPSEYTFVKVGILAVNKANYNEATFKAGTTDSNVYDRSPGSPTASGAFSWTKSNVAAGQTWVAKAYVQYRSASGELVTVYSDMVEATK
ncbi:MAG: InlB B-repeat-containing protein [Ruminococcus sp.]|nr:InlB B-repeat-containing protein [Ruminococcus sp.]